MDRDGVVQYLLSDHLHSTSLVLNDDGTEASRMRFLPYGEERWSSGTLPTDYKFTGQRKIDSAGGIYHMGARFYDGSLGRWTSPDTLVPDPTNPQSFNRYAWVLGNPLRYRDPTGHREEGECGYNGEACQDDPPPQPPALPDWLILLLAEHPEFWAVLETTPSAFGEYAAISGSFGVILEGEINAQTALMFNWHSGELTFLYGPGADFYIGTPRWMSIPASGGGMYTWGASRNEYLKGLDAYAGLGLEANAEATCGGEIVVSRGLDYDDVNDNGRLDLIDSPVWAVDPRYKTSITSLQMGANVGASAIPTGASGGVSVGVSMTKGFNIISGWDSRVWAWNWFK